VHAIDVLAIVASREARVIWPDHGEVATEIGENLGPTAEIAAAMEKEQGRTLTFREDTKPNARDLDISYALAYDSHGRLLRCFITSVASRHMSQSRDLIAYCLDKSAP
jgi:hypothetical protein